MSVLSLSLSLLLSEVSDLLTGQSVTCQPATPASLRFLILNLVCPKTSYFHNHVTSPQLPGIRKYLAAMSDIVRYSRYINGCTPTCTCTDWAEDSLSETLDPKPVLVPSHQPLSRSFTFVVGQANQNDSSQLAPSLLP